MKNKVIKIISLIFIVLIITNIICAITNKAQAISDVTEDLEFWEPDDEGSSTGLIDKVGIIVTVVRVAGIAISVGTLSVIGIKFMLGSVEEKAQYKQTLLPWLIGAILVFAMTTAPTIIYNMVRGTGTSTGSGTSTGTGGSSTEKVHILLNASDLTLKLGEYEETTINAIVTGTNKKVKWESSNTQVATVDLTGKVTARSKGTATITAYVGKATATCKVTVEAAVTTNITISKDMVILNVPITNSYQLTATITPVTSKEPITWSSSNSNVVTVSNNGKVKAVGAGEAIITAKSGSKTDTCTVKVENSVESGKMYYNPSTGKVSTTRNSNSDLGFILDVPDVSVIKDLDKLPLIVFLHGLGECGNNLDVVENYWKGRPFYSKDYPAIIIYPQCPANTAWIDIHSKVKGLIDYSIENYNVDRDKIALTGFSWGGSGAWRIGTKYPTLFSCIVPVSGYDSTKPQTFPDCPVWIFYSTTDESYNSSNSINRLLKNNGRKVKLTKHTVQHANMPNKVYTDDMIKWMIEPNDDFQF